MKCSTCLLVSGRVYLSTKPPPSDPFLESPVLIRSFTDLGNFTKVLLFPNVSLEWFLISVSKVFFLGIIRLEPTKPTILWWVDVPNWSHGEIPKSFTELETCWEPKSPFRSIHPFSIHGQAEGCGVWTRGERQARIFWCPEFINVNKNLC